MGRIFASEIWGGEGGLFSRGLIFRGACYRILRYTSTTINWHSLVCKMRSVIRDLE